MKIAVIGAGAIGALAAGYLNEQGVAAGLVGRDRDVAAINKNGLVIQGVRGEKVIPVRAASELAGGNDLIILAVKTQDIAATLKDNLKAMKDAAVLTVQNGVRAEALLKAALPEMSIVSSIVMFGGTYLEPGRVVHNFEGSWVMGRAFAPNDDKIEAIGKVLGNALPVVITSNIRGMKWLKLFLNMNNCLPAILGKSMQESFASLEIARLAMRLWQEALAVVDKAGIALESLPDFPVAKLRGLAGMPVSDSAKIYSGMMVNLSKEPLYGSILQSLKRGRPSEIDYINGEIAVLGEEIGMAAPLNRQVTEMVHRVETSGSFFPEAAVLAELER